MTTTTTVDSKVDRWVQRLSLAAMVAVALSLLGVGVVLYAPGAQAARTEGRGRSSAESDETVSLQQRDTTRSDER